MHEWINAYSIVSVLNRKLALRACLLVNMHLETYMSISVRARERERK